MSWDVRDRYIWLGFGAFLFVAVKGISNSLRTTIILSDVYDPDYAKTANETQAEDSISIEALSTLTTSPNIDISNTATTLILSRFAQDDSSASALTLDLFSPNSDTRRKAKQLLDLFDNIGTEIYPLRDSAVSTLHDKSGPTTQIMCRAFFRASRRYRRGLASLRDIAEVVEDSTIIDSAPSQTPRYPDSHFAFPYPLAPLNDSDVGVRFHPASQRVESLVELLADQALTTRPMVRFASSGASSGASSTSDQQLQEENDIAGDAVFTARAPTLSQSNREAEVRRQRREAMVLHEGEGVIGRENIIHPRREHGA